MVSFRICKNKLAFSFKKIWLLHGSSCMFWYNSKLKIKFDVSGSFYEKWTFIVNEIMCYLMDCILNFSLSMFLIEVISKTLETAYIIEVINRTFDGIFLGIELIKLLCLITIPRNLNFQFNSLIWILEMFYMDGRVQILKK